MKNNLKLRHLLCFCMISTLFISVFVVKVNAQVEPGVRARTGEPLVLPPAKVLSISPVFTEYGKISLSVDGLGTLDNNGIIQVEKPVGATVRRAFLAAASMALSNRILIDGDVKIDGADVNWDMSTPSTIGAYNHWAEVTSIVKPKIDAAPPGRVNFTITEVRTLGIDGEILAVIFDDPGQITENTVVLFFGAQDIAGDTFVIGLADPLDMDDPSLILDMGLGISFGFQQATSPTGQYSIIDVNGVRLSTSAGGQDDGDNKNGSLLTVGGLDDSNANPADPFQLPGGPRTDDELYNLKPFVSTGDVSIIVETINPSNDDNIFFASLFLTVTGVVEGIVLGPSTASNVIGVSHTVTATVLDDLGNPIVGRDVEFEIISGPHAGLTGSDVTDPSGEASFTYTGTSIGTDVIIASFVNNKGDTIISNKVTKEWYSELQCQVTIVSPTDGAIICKDSVRVKGIHDVSSGFPPYTVTCDVNGIPATVSGINFEATVPVESGYNLIVAKCTVTDSCSNTAVCSDSISVFYDDIPPTCDFTQDETGVTGTFTDNESGIASIVSLYLVGGILEVDPFTPGDKNVAFRIIREDPAASIGFDIQVTDMCGNILICDPIMQILSADGITSHQEFSFPSVERYFQLTNHGLSQVEIDLNGNKFSLFTDPFRAEQEINTYLMPMEGSVTIDMQKYLLEENTMIIEVGGLPGTNADMIISNFSFEVNYILELQPILPEVFQLAQNYPNPFNPETNMRFNIPAQMTEGAHVQLCVYNVLGQLVRTLVNETRFPGQHVVKWDSKNDLGDRVPSGVYFYTIVAGDFKATKKMTLLK